MPQGFGLIDYVGFAACLLFTGWALATNPLRLLLGLPFIVTAYFIAPLVTYQTPGKVIPLILLGWMILTNRLNVIRSQHNAFILIGCLVFVNFAAALIIGGSGIRPIMRILHYADLVGIFAFSVWACRKPQGLQLAMWGLVICAGIHGAYALYQLFAFQFGLPFRAIVRGTNGGFSLAVSNGILRVNGLADEPKRVAYLFFAGALAALYLANTVRGFMRTALRGGACVAGLLSFITLSGSFLGSLIIAIGTMAFFSIRLWKFFPVVILSVGLFVVISPRAVNYFSETLTSSMDDRLEEVSVGLDADRIYRQEFFAQDLVQNDFTTLIFGLGLGRYNQVLHDRYGFGAGLAENGSLLPLNSQIFEVGFDLGLPGIVVLYIGSLFIFLRIRGSGLFAFYLRFIVLVVILQSIFVQSLYLGAFVLGVAVAFAEVQRNSRRVPRVGASSIKPGSQLRPYARPLR